MPALAISMKKIRTQAKLSNKKSNSYKFIYDIARFNFTMTLHSKLILLSMRSTLCFPEPRFND